jgi:hypothetical protein
MRNRDFLSLFRSKFDVMLKLSDAGLREITQAMFDFLEEREPTFSDAQAQALWWCWSLEFNAQEKQAQEFADRQSERGRLGACAKKNKHKQKILAQAENFSASKNIVLNEAQAEQAENFSQTYTYTNTDTNTNTDIYSYGAREDDSVLVEHNAPTLEQVISAGKMPDVNLSEAECRKCFDYYEARDWRDAKGRRLKWLPLLRKWSGSQHEFVLTGTAKEPKEPISLEDFRKAYRKVYEYDFEADFCDDMPHHRAVLNADLDTLKTKYKADYDSILADWNKDFSKLKKAVRENKRL